MEQQNFLHKKAYKSLTANSQITKTLEVPQ